MDLDTASRRPGLTAPQRWAMAAAAIAAGCLFTYGIAGSYSSVTRLAAAHHVPLSRLVPVGIDGGLVGTVLLDIVLTWTGYPVWWLRWLVRLLTMGTVAANAAAGWPDPVGTGLHLAAPVMILAVVEAVRSVLLRRPIEAGARRDSVLAARWLLAPWATWKLWRRMVLWQITSYRTALDTEQRRLRTRYQLRHRYGPDWPQHVPDDVAWMLRDGVLLDEAFAQVVELTAQEARPPQEPPRLAVTDDDLAADMRTRWPHARPSRELVRTTYRIGSGRARRLLGRWTAADPMTHRAGEVAMPGLPAQVRHVDQQFADWQLERDGFADEVGPRSGWLTDKRGVGVLLQRGGDVLRGGECQPADDDEQRAAAVDGRTPDQMWTSGLSRKVSPPPFQRMSMTSLPGWRVSMKPNSLSQNASSGSAR